MLPAVRLKRAAAVLSTCSLAVLLSGCGYTLVHYAGSAGTSPGQKRVAIETLENGSFEPGYEFTVTDALLREFQRRGAVRVVQDVEAADLVLSGQVRRIDTRRGAFSSVVLVLEYEIRVQLDLKVSRRDGSAIKLDRRVLTATELYLASADVEAQRKNREEALRRVASVLATRVHDALYEATLR